MAKLVILKLGEGSFEQGFTVTLQLGDDGDRPTIEITGKLPPLSEIPQYYSCWQTAYRSLGLPSRLEAAEAQVTNVSITDCRNTAQLLHDSLNAWLCAESFRPVREKLLEQLMPSDEVRVIVQTEDIQLQRLPWHLWDLCNRYPKAEIALSAPAYEYTRQPSSVKAEIKILAILGNSAGIDTQVDRNLLEELPSAKSTFLVEPQLKEINDYLWQQSWDILFFAGHSSSGANGETGRIYINKTDSLTIADLKYALRKAVERGLKIAIFNSCDGLGLALDLADLHIPQVIVMREPVPDRVAQEFFKYFLQAFSRGVSLYSAVREARERLQGLERDFPCATWLPVICQNPAEVPLVWPVCQPKPQPIFRRRCLQTLFVMSAVATALVMGVRHLGILQLWELQAYDQMMRMRPSEQPDTRILIVKVDEKDIRKYGFPLPDGTLAQLLKKLKQHQPQAIGLDIYRDLAQPPGHEDFVSQLRDERLITVCKLSNGEDDGIAPPPNSQAPQLGFSDFVDDKQSDNQDYTIRRYLLSYSPNSISTFSLCNAPRAFSLQLALGYLKAKGIRPEVTPEQDWKLGNIVFKRLATHTGGYQNLDARGNQVLLNYRSYRDVAQQVTVTDILTNQFDPTWVKNRVILVGVTAKSVPDNHDTPYGKMRGLLIHAHMVSQILSTVLDQRPLIWWLPQWGDALWVWTWALTGGVIVWRRRSLLYLVVTGSFSMMILYGFCFGFLIQGSWVPLVPAVLALVTTGGICVVLDNRGRLLLSDTLVQTK